MATSSGLAGTLTETAVAREENTTLKLKLKKKKQTKKIQWTEDTVDNEGIEYELSRALSSPFLTLILSVVRALPYI